MSLNVLTEAESSPKLAHYTDDDIVGAVLYLAPAKNSGRNMCPFASAGCAQACLYRAGRGEMQDMQDKRIAKTRRFLEHRAEFMALLVHDIRRLENRALRTGTRCVIRLNGTSDWLWEREACERNGMQYPNLMAAFPNVTFYDYTKIPNRTVPANYHLTFSLSENNDKHALAELARGRNVAVVINAGSKLPATWAGLPVIDGDAHDYRFLDPQGHHIVALLAKGPAKKDCSGFVRPLADSFDPSRKFIPFTLVK